MFWDKLKYTNEELISALKMSDDKAWTFIDKEYRKIAIGMFFNKGGDKKDFENVFQDSIITFYEKINKEDFKLNRESKSNQYYSTSSC